MAGLSSIYVALNIYAIFAYLNCKWKLEERKEGTGGDEMMEKNVFFEIRR
jgi:hypothetical protein